MLGVEPTLKKIFILTRSLGLRSTGLYYSGKSEKKLLEENCEIDVKNNRR